MNCEKEKITPETARQFLETVPEHQRKVKSRNVQKIAIDIKSGNWRENGATIVFDTKGALIDGQHRCHAIIAANRPVWALVVRGVSASMETFHTVDSVSPRSIADFLRIGNPNGVAAVARLFWVQQKGTWTADIASGGLRSKQKGVRVSPPIADVLKVSEPHLEQMNACYLEIEKARKVIGLGSFCAFLLFYYRFISPVKEQERLTEFWKRVGDGVGLAAGDPALTLRNKRASMSTNERRIDRTATATIIKCLHAYLDGKPVKVASYREGEEFPDLRGVGSNGNGAHRG